MTMCVFLILAHRLFFSGFFGGLLPESYWEMVNPVYVCAAKLHCLGNKDPDNGLSKRSFKIG